MIKIPNGTIYVMTKPGILTRTDLTGEQITKVLEHSASRIDKLEKAFQQEEAEVARIKSYLKQMKITLEALI